MKKYIYRNNDNLEVIKAIVKISNTIIADKEGENLIYIERDFTRFKKVIMLCREIYCKWLNDFLSLGRMCEYYGVDLVSLKRIIAIGKHSSNNHNWILKCYK